MCFKVCLQNTYSQGFLHTLLLVLSLKEEGKGHCRTMATCTAGRPQLCEALASPGHSKPSLPQALLGELPRREAELSLASLARGNNLHAFLV